MKNDKPTFKVMAVPGQAFVLSKEEYDKLNSKNKSKQVIKEIEKLKKSEYFKNITDKTKINTENEPGL